MSEPILSYPLDVDEKDGHYILLTIFESPGINYPSPFTDINLPQNRYNLSQIRQLGESNTKALRLRNAVTRSNGSGARVAFRDKFSTNYQGSKYDQRSDVRTFAGQGNAEKSVFKGAISLYTPQQIQVSHKMNYQQEDMSFVGANIGGLLEAIGSKNQGFMNKMKGTLDSFKDAGQALVSNLGQFAGTGGLQQSIFGSAVNRNLAEVIFTGLEYRQFTMEFSFMPRNMKEAEEVDNIINMLTFYALPNRKQNTARTFDIPAEFNLKYMYYNRINRYIHQPLTLALESIDIKYGGSKFATFRGNSKGAQPIKTDMTLTFRELEYADSHTLYGAASGLDDTFARKHSANRHDNFVEEQLKENSEE